MSIRIRVVDGVTVALCAARSVSKPDDMYLDDAAHHALSMKFSQDFNSEGCWPIAESAEDNALREREESNNPNRAWWDKTYGPEADR